MRRARIRGRGGRRRATTGDDGRRRRWQRRGRGLGGPVSNLRTVYIGGVDRERLSLPSAGAARAGASRGLTAADGGTLGYYCIRPRPHTRSSPDPDPGPAPRPSRVFVCPPALQPSSPCRPCSSPHTRAHTPDTRVSSAAGRRAVSRCCAALPLLFFPFGNSFVSRAVAAHLRDALHFLPLRLIDNPAIHETSPGPSTSRPPPPPVKPLLSFTSRFPSLKTPRPLARLPPALPTNTPTTATTLSPAVSSTTSFHPSQSYI
ncbi:hypothetical protein HETIRDRAFT_166327 [Heterobasidion irregulare TC 32-1]|uniref:Uncharacterized protein n=1 Tax=Heterobasidion irregulare (strain TC 32-1) TaxID=747525 RepID=W4KLV7_HETIT|nr:uncharacterized protein HETIRDRAFT_166327 [Heterobasidion irregulare TC 32-1]ETW86813.1 hypothetical protein HETIRDRAFT_166327 [Heterobasidion irregulare TC 32-1]